MCSFLRNVNENLSNQSFSVPRCKETHPKSQNVQVLEKNGQKGDELKGKAMYRSIREKDKSTIKYGLSRTRCIHHTVLCLE